MSEKGGYPTQSYPTQGYPTQSYPTQGYPAQGYPTQGYPAQADYPPAYTDANYSNNYEANKPTSNYVMGAQPQPVVVAPSVPSAVVVLGAPVLYGDHNVQTVCPSCRANILTDLKYETGIATWLIAGGLCFLGLWCGCCLIPFCVDACKDVEHYCPNCRTLIGRHKKL